VPRIQLIPYCFLSTYASHRAGFFMSGDLPMLIINPLFHLGDVVATPQSICLLSQSGMSLLDLLQRHATGDWGDLCTDDINANNDALQYGDRLLSSYVISDSCKVWVITEYDRSVTTVLLPSEY
jgi:hypothetical protein